MAGFKVGNVVRIIETRKGSLNPVGSVGIITEIDIIGLRLYIRVQVEGYTDDNMENWHDPSQLIEFV